VAKVGDKEMIEAAGKEVAVQKKIQGEVEEDEDERVKEAAVKEVVVLKKIRR